MTDQLAPCWRRKETWHCVVPGEYAIKDIRVSSRWVQSYGHNVWDVIDAAGRVVETWPYIRFAKQKALEIAAQ